MHYASRLPAHPAGSSSIQRPWAYGSELVPHADNRRHVAHLLAGKHLHMLCVLLQTLFLLVSVDRLLVASDRILSGPLRLELLFAREIQQSS